MRKTLTILLAAVVLGILSFAGQAQQAANVAGAWELTTESSRGAMTSELTIEQNGENIIVTQKSQRGESKGTGTIKGNAIEWSITRTTPRGEMTTTYKGTVEGDKMAGTAAMGQMGELKWTATRKK